MEIRFEWKSEFVIIRIRTDGIDQATIRLTHEQWVRALPSLQDLGTSRTQLTAVTVWEGGK